MVEYLWDGEMDCGWEDLGEKVVDISGKFVDNLLDLMPFSYNEEAIKLITEESLGRFQNLAKKLAEEIQNGYYCQYEDMENVNDNAFKLNSWILLGSLTESALQIFLAFYMDDYKNSKWKQWENIVVDEIKTPIIDSINGLKEKETGARAEKKYYGQMIVSRKLSIAYVVLTDRRLGELMFISFPYNQQLNHKDNIGSIAFVCGCSSNENSKMPVVYRMLFTRIDLNENDELDKLKANLLMNTSIIRIEKDKLDHLLNEWGDGDVIKRLMNQITELDLGIELKEFYEITEHSIRQINEKKLKDMTKDELILQIREEATADKYNKISGSLAERIVNALLKIQKEREE